MSVSPYEWGELDRVQELLDDVDTSGLVASAKELDVFK